MAVKILLAVALAILVGFMYPFTGSKHHVETSDLDPGFRGLTPGTYLQNQDHLWLYTRKWEVANPKAAVFFTHGYGEHSQRYAELADALNHHGISVYTYDQQGHGLSEGDRMYCESFEHLLTDHAMVVDKLVPKDLPLFLFGHSMGGLVTMWAMERRPDRFRGAVMTGPVLINSVYVPEIVNQLANYISKLFPHMPIANVDLNLISRNHTIVEEARASHYFDPSRPIPARAGLSMRDAAEKALELRVKWPFFVLHGSEDGIIKPEGSQHLYDKALSKDKTIKIYPGLYHEVVFEPEKQEVISDIVEWIAARI